MYVYHHEGCGLQSQILFLFFIVSSLLLRLEPLKKAACGV
jgi:hypothetical protein